MLLVLLWQGVSAQLVVNNALTPAQLVGILTGPGVLISNVTYSGLPVQAGQFTATGTNLGIANGIMLSTASCSLSIGPNLIDNATEDLLQPGDPVLDLQAGTGTFDAAILEFDFIPQNDTVSFRYVFASEEYPEYVCSVFNDAFAFQISGPGYASPTNIAFIPGTSTPVAINTVNIGASGNVGSPAPSCDTSNASYFVDNIGGGTVQLDGFTVPLTATAIVVPCQTYHLRISIADAGDGGWDSSVFFEAGSLSSTPVVDAGVDRAFCGAGTATLGFPGAAGWNYAWSPPTGLSNPNIPNPSVSVTGAITTTTTYIVTASNGSCILRDTVLVSVSPPPTASFTVANACSGKTIPVTFTGSAPAGAVYSWNFGGGIVVSGSGAGPYAIAYPTVGNYTVTLQVTVGTCTSSAPNQSVVIHPAPTAPLAIVNDIDCSGAANGSITLTPQGGTAPYQIVWTPSVSSTNTATGLSPGSYSFVITDANSCTVSDSFQVYEPFPLLITPSGVPPLCSGSPSGTVSVSVQGGSSPYSYLWTNTGDTTGSITGIVSGDYTCVVTDANGCTASASANVAPQIVVIPVAQATPSVICPGESVSLEVTGGYSFAWTDGSTDSLRTVAPDSTLLYSVVATDPNGCTGSDSVLVQVAPRPQSLFVASSVCFGDATTFTQQSTISSGVIQQVEWDFGDGTTSANSQPQHVYTMPGTYTATLLVTSDVGCTDSISVPAIVYSLPVATWTSSPENGCVPWPVDFSAQQINGATYQWTFGPTITNGSSPSVIFDLPGDYPVTLSVVDANGCTDDSVLIDYVHVYPLPDAGFTITPDAVTEFMPRIELKDASSGAVQWYWDLGDTTISTEQEPVHTYDYPGTYEIRQIVRNMYGCIDTLVRTLEVGRDYAFYIPNAFTPNGDGSNDFFEVKGYNFFDYRIAILNRWGKQIFTSEDPAISWDGTQRGEHVQEGIYDYIVNFNDVFGKPHLHYGRVTVIR